MVKKIPLHKPFLSGNEAPYLSELLASGDIRSDGRFTTACSRLIEDAYSIKRVLITPSCTAALEMAAILCDLGPGDEVLLPSFTFSSTANAILRVGASPVFVDIRNDTLNIDANLVEDAITPQTKAIFPVHYAGVGCEMTRLMDVARRHNLHIVEDAAQGLNSFYSGRVLGSIGTLGAYSFHHTKNYGCGEGGALCINSEDLIERAEIVRDKGTDRNKLLRGEVEHYSWTDIGSSFLPSEIACAFLFAQLEIIDWITESRKRVCQLYDELLQPLEEEGLLRLPFVPEDCESNYHIYYILLPDVSKRDGLMRWLNDNNVGAASHFVPLHSSPMGQKLGYSSEDLPVTQSISGRILRLPIYPALTEDEQHYIIRNVIDYLQSTQTSNAPSELSHAAR